MKDAKSVVLITITEEMKQKCPFSTINCLHCLSQACKHDPLEDLSNESCPICGSSNASCMACSLGRIVVPKAEVPEESEISICPHCNGTEICPNA